MRFVRTVENLFGLPAGFQRTEYLESTGTQYIDTGVLPVNDMEFECKFTFTSLVSTNLTIVGSRDGEKRCQPIGAYNNKWSASIGGAYDANGKSVSSGTPYTINAIITNGQTITTNVNGSQASTCTSTTGLPSQELYIFARNFYGNTDSKVNGRLYFLKIKANGALVRDFIPCIDQLGVPCMYDLVGKKPYYNAGTGSFTVGRQVIPVEYLESSGTQYIDTGVKYNSSNYYKIENKIYYGSKNQQFQVQGWDAGGVNGMAGTGLFSDGSSIYGPSCENKSVITEQIINSGTNTQTVTNYNVEGTTGSLSRAHANLPLYAANGGYGIFACYSQTSFTYNASCKVYYYRIYQNGTLVRDYIPCKDENNVGFMFDKVSGTCYLNAGTGDFIVGEPIYTSKLRLIRDAIRIPAGYTRVEYLESSGTQYINTGFKPNTNTRTVGRCYFNSWISSNADYVFGVFESPNNYGFNVGSARQYFNVPWGSNAGIPLNGLIPQPNTDYEFDISKTGYKINGTSYGTVSSESVNSTRNMYLFWSNGTSASGMNGRIYYFQIWDNGTLVRSFIPVRDSNNVGYMYDEVTGQLFGNAGSGSFVVGNDLLMAKVRFIQDVIPSDYIPLKYLESTGTQWIDTGLFVGQGYGCHIKLYPTNTSETSSFVGGSESNNTNEYAVYCYMDNAFIRNGTNNSTNTSGTIVSSNVKLQGIEIQHQGDSVIWTFANGYTLTETLASNKWSVVDSPYKLVLFAMNRGNNINPMQGKFSFIKIFRYGVPVRDFYPALRKSDNKPGMYDRITKQFFTNAATSGNDFNYE